VTRFSRWDIWAALGLAVLLGLWIDVRIQTANIQRDLSARNGWRAETTAAIHRIAERLDRLEAGHAR